MKKNSLILTIILLSFTGCISITKEIPASSTYTLNVDKSTTINKNSSHTTIEIKEPNTLSSLNSKYISYATKPYISENYAFSKWSDTPTKMIQNQSIKYLSSTNNYNFVNSSNINVRSDYQVLSEIDNFHQYFQENKSYVKFTIRVYLKNRKNTYYQNFSYTQLCTQNNAIGAVKAFNVVVNTFVKDLDKWILTNIQ
jgi:ABC-type uncharacterized transport system auxiliary subunit